MQEEEGRGTTTHSLTLLGLVLQDSFSPLLCAGEYRGKGWSDEPPLTGTMKHDSTISDTQLGVAGDRSRSFQGNKNWRNYLLLNPKQNKAENDIKTNISDYNALEYGLLDKTQTQCIKRIK